MSKCDLVGNEQKALVLSHTMCNVYAVKINPYRPLVLVSLGMLITGQMTTSDLDLSLCSSATSSYSE